MVVSVGEAETVLFDEQDASPTAAAAAATSGLRPTYLRLLRLGALAILIVGLVCCWRRRGRNKGGEYKPSRRWTPCRTRGIRHPRRRRRRRRGRDQDEAEDENEFHFVVPPTRSGRALQDEEDDIEASAAQEVKEVEAIKPSARQSRESRQVEAAPIMEVDEETTKAVTLAQLRALGLR